MSVEPQAHERGRDREPPRRDPDLPARPGVRRAGQRDAGPVRRGRGGLRRVLGQPARERLTWSKPFTKTLEWDLPFAKWFSDGELNVTYNCVDRHVENGLGDKVAYHWIGEPGETRTLTYADLQRESSKAANALKELGVTEGRPGRDLHADDPRAADRDARLRPHRRAAHRGVRRVLGRGAERPHQRLPRRSS